MIIIKSEKIVTRFQEYIIIDFIDDNMNNVRGLFSGSSFQSMTLTSNNSKFKLYNDYTKLFDIIVTNDNSINNVLVLGGGGFSYPKYYLCKYPNKLMDVVEIDKDVIDIALKYFFLQDAMDIYDKEKNRLSIINEDAIKYINDCKKHYDFVFIDLFFDSKVVLKVFNDSIISNIFNIIDPKYIMVNYIIKNGYDKNEIESLQSTLNIYKKYYKNIRMITVPNIDIKKGYNILIFISNNEMNLSCNYDYKDFILK